MDSDCGIAVAGVFRELTTDDSVARVVLDISALSPVDHDAFCSKIQVEEDRGNICFGSGECLRVLCGPKNQFDSHLRFIGSEGFNDVCPRHKGWSLSTGIGFSLPNHWDSAVLDLGDHSIPIDLRGIRDIRRRAMVHH